MMRLLGSLNGSGILSVKGNVLGTIDYTIDIRGDDHLQIQSSEGTAAGDYRLLREALDACSAVLHLQSGATVEIVMTEASRFGGEFRVLGPVPGFESRASSMEACSTEYPAETSASTSVFLQWRAR